MKLRSLSTGDSGTDVEHGYILIIFQTPCEIQRIKLARELRYFFYLNPESADRIRLRSYRPSRIASEKYQKYIKPGVLPYANSNSGTDARTPRKTTKVPTASIRSVPAERRRSGGSDSAIPENPSAIVKKMKKSDALTTTAVYTQIRRQMNDKNNMMSPFLRPSGSRNTICGSDSICTSKSSAL